MVDERVLTERVCSWVQGSKRVSRMVARVEVGVVGRVDRGGRGVVMRGGREVVDWVCMQVGLG